MERRKKWEQKPLTKVGGEKKNLKALIERRETNDTGGGGT